MTRINLVPVQELYDQHLFAEFREIKMVPRSLERSLAARGVFGVLNMIPPAYVLGKGHVSFFYNKGAYLRERYSRIRAELACRGINFDQEAPFDPNGVMRGPFAGGYTPTPEALALVRERIASRVAMKPAWYRHTEAQQAAA
jgi:deoxyribonuclease (pyrimidine dimer)